MTPGLTSDAVECHGCGYDLRAHAPDSQCPECGASVTESRRLAAIPRRPAWRDSDPRWRRRILLGAWLLVLIPIGTVIRTSEWASTVLVPTPLHLRGPLPLQDTFAVAFGFSAYVTFFMGVVLLFSNERNRRRGRFDWTRGAGVTTSYGVFLLGIPHFAYLSALVVVGIAALFLSMPARLQPAETGLLIKLGAGYLYYGPYPTLLVELSTQVFSAFVVMLACVPLYNALCSAGRKMLAMLFLAPLVIASLLQILYAVQIGLDPSRFDNYYTVVNYYPFYFKPESLVAGYSSSTARFIVEAVKWAACLAIATRLSLAQIRSWWHRGIVVLPAKPKG